MSPRADLTYVVNYPIPQIYTDGLNERFIDKNRHRINVRDQNALEELLKIQRKKASQHNNQDLDQAHVSKKLSTLSLLSIPGETADEKAFEFGKLANKTYDDSGQTFQIQHLNAEKLPKLIASNDMKVRLPSRRISPEVPEARVVSGTYNQENIFRGAGLDKIELNQEGNLNIRANMKPAHGIVYKEDNFREAGGDYMEKFNGKSKKKFSLEQYNSLFGKNSSCLKERALSKMEELLPNKSSLAFDANKSTQEFFMPPTILSKSGNFESTMLNTTTGINLMGSNFVTAKSR